MAWYNQLAKVVSPAYLLTSKKKGQQQVQKAEPWQPQQDYLKDIFSNASNIYQRPYQGYSDQFNNMSPEMAQALEMQRQRALSGNSLESQGANALSGMLSPEFLTGENFQNQFQAAANKLAPQINSQFALAGRARGGLAQQARTEGLANAYGGLLGQQMDRQQRAAQIAPILANQDLQNLASVGQQKEAYASNLQNMDYNKLMQFLQAIQGNYGGTTTINLPSTSRAVGMAGGALGGASLGGQYGGGYGAAIGAGIGGLLGAY